MLLDAFSHENLHLGLAMFPSSSPRGSHAGHLPARLEHNKRLRQARSYPPFSWNAWGLLCCILTRSEAQARLPHSSQFTTKSINGNYWNSIDLPC